MHASPITLASSHAAAHASCTNLAVTVAVGVETVVCGVDGDISSGDINDECLNSFIALIDQQCSVPDIYGSIGVNAVISCGNGNVSACQRDFSGRVDAVICSCHIYGSGLYIQISIFFFVGSDKAVIARIDCDRSLLDAEAVICVNGVRRGSHGDRSSCDDEIIIGRYSMSVCCVHREASAAVDRQVIMGENSSVCPVAEGLVRVCRTAGQGILTAFRECQEDFVGLIHPDACIVAAIDFYTIEPNEDFGGIIGVYRQITISERAGNYVVPGIRDHYVPVTCIGTVSGDDGFISLQCDHGRL